MAAPSGPAPVQYVPFQSSVEPAFWSELSQKKLNVYRLDDSQKPIVGMYSVSGVKLASPLALSPSAFNPEKTHHTGGYTVDGVLYNANTVEQFKKYDKTAILNEAAAKIWASITSGECLTTPSALTPFVLLTFADLKTHKFYYWFGFPALCPKGDGLHFTVSTPAQKLSSHFTEPELSSFFGSLAELREKSNPPFFLAKKQGGKVVTAPLSDIKTFFTPSGEVMVGFMDPTHQHMHPGWAVRNLLIAVHCHLPSARTIGILCIRGTAPTDDLSMYMGAAAPPADSALATAFGEAQTKLFTSAHPLEDSPFKAVGWEMTIGGRPGARFADLASVMDPMRLAETSVNLNLQLMKWRLMPDLDIEKVSKTRCLLLGAGTLGCAVGRVLMGWGVRTITFVDNGKVSHSNPARQSLFEFSDVGKDKAAAAAERMTKIFPGLHTKGVALTIPMPGHAVAGKAAEDTKAAVRSLEGLVADHDVVFLLTDSRESRWLPTVVARAQGKLLMNAALGFDSYLVMRHGNGSHPPAAGASTSAGTPSGLGCYFCNDVVAPADSLTDRTLDQQCTVTRPGLAFSAASLLVELMVSTIQHPDGVFAMPGGPAGGEYGQGGSPLGEIPHQVRGYLSNFKHMIITGNAFDRCTACSQYVVDAVAKDGIEFYMNVFNDSVGQYLEDLTGLTAMKQQVDDLVWDGDGDGGEDGDDF